MTTQQTRQIDPFIHIVIGVVASLALAAFAAWVTYLAYQAASASQRQLEVQPTA